MGIDVECECYEYVAITPCHIKYYDCNGLETTLIITQQDLGEIFYLDVNKDLGIIEDICGCTICRDINENGL